MNVVYERDKERERGRETERRGGGRGGEASGHKRPRRRKTDSKQEQPTGMTSLSPKTSRVALLSSLPSPPFPPHCLTDQTSVTVDVHRLSPSPTKHRQPRHGRLGDWGRVGGGEAGRGQHKTLTSRDLVLRPPAALDQTPGSARGQPHCLDPQSLKIFFFAPRRKTRSGLSVMTRANSLLAEKYEMWKNTHTKIISPRKKTDY